MVDNSTHMEDNNIHMEDMVVMIMEEVEDMDMVEEVTLMDLDAGTDYFNNLFKFKEFYHHFCNLF